MFAVFDLDGTLAIGTHREHYITRDPGQKDWDSYFAACGHDEPNWPVMRILTSFVADGDRVEIWTARSASVRDTTLGWLGRFGVPRYVNLRMRGTEDRTQDDVLKRQWYEEAPQKPDVVFEDRNRVVEMWRSLGVPCLQVAEGDF